MEKGVRTRDGDWLFNTFKGQFFRVSTEDDAPVASAEFSLADLEPGWLVGGMQPLAYHTDSNLLLVLVHADDGSDDVLHTTHKDPGEEIWYIDLGQKRIKHRLPLESPITSIQVSQDASPLLYAGSVITNAVEVYDLKSTGHIGTIEDAGFPTILQNL